MRKVEKYNPQKIEPKWEKRWEKAKIYRAVDFSKKKKIYCLVEFPYCSGEGLHLGHAFTNTIMDIYARKKRMSGFNVLHPMGWDAFGLPTENYAIKTGINPRVITDRNTQRFKKQDIRLGLGYDWGREIDTSDPDYYKWTQWIFLQLFNSFYDRHQQKAVSIQELITSFEQEGNTQHICPGNPTLQFTATAWEAFSEKNSKIF